MALVKIGRLSTWQADFVALQKLSKDLDWIKKPIAGLSPEEARYIRTKCIRENRSLADVTAELIRKGLSDEFQPDQAVQGLPLPEGCRLLP